MKPIRHILFATDFSKASRRAFDTAKALAKSSKARLTIAYVHIPIVPLVPEQYIDSPKWLHLDLADRGAATRQLAALASAAKRAGVTATTLLLVGEPSQLIVRASASKHADMVVIGTHGRKGLSKFFLGSVAERVVAMARCPVLTVRG